MLLLLTFNGGEAIDPSHDDSDMEEYGFSVPRGKSTIYHGCCVKRTHGEL